MQLSYLNGQQPMNFLYTPNCKQNLNVQDTFHKAYLDLINIYFIFYT
jgi:hypothetical protein